VVFDLYPSNERATLVCPPSLASCSGVHCPAILRWRQVLQSHILVRGEEPLSDYRRRWAAQPTVAVAVYKSHLSASHILLEPANTILAKDCLGTLLQFNWTNTLTRSRRALLAQYAAEYWADHVLFEEVPFCVRKKTEDLFDQRPVQDLL